MASKTLNKFIDLYTSMNEGKITYEEFLDLSDPKNPDGIYKDVLDKIDKAIGSKEFANIDDASRIKVLNVRTNILTKGDDPEMIGIKDNFGFDPSTLATHRLLLKQGLKPVLDLTEKESKEDMGAAMQKQMSIIMPLMIGFFAYSFPLGLSLYWNTFTVFGIIQQHYLNKKEH